MAKQNKFVAKPRAWRKSKMSLWHEAANPLRNLTLPRAMMIYDHARHGNYADLLWLYHEIEAADPTLMICRDRRESALVELDWNVILKRATRLRRRWDKQLALEQQSFLEEAYGACNNFENACEHLMDGFFRGFAHARPIYSSDSLALLDFELLDGWNFVRNRATGAWHWNPNATSSIQADALDEIPATELVSVVRSRHIDYPAFSLYLRAALGETLWGEFIERYGIPPVMVVMPEFADKKEELRYLEASEKLCEGASGALPYGSQVHYAGESRGTDPFSAFLKHQQELIVLLSTGGLLTTLTASGSGTLAGEAHTDSWRTIVRRDARLLAAAFEARVTHDLLTTAFPGKPHLVEFAFETEAKPTADAVFTTAGKARTAGYRIDRGDLEEKTGYTLIEEQNTPQNGNFGGFGGALMNKESATPLQNDGIPLQNSRSEKDGVTDGSEKHALKTASGAIPAATMEAAALDALAEARAASLAPVIDRLLDALAVTDDAAMLAALKSLYADLPRLAEVAAANDETVNLIERILSDAVGAGWQEGKTGPVANKDRAQDGQFATKGTGDQTGGGTRPREGETKGNRDNYGTTETTKLSNDPVDNIRRGKSVATHLLSKKAGSEPHAMYRSDTGWIGMEYGTPGNKDNDYKGGHGLSHIMAKHKDVTPQSLCQTIQQGKAYKHERIPSKLYLLHDNSVAVIAKDRNDRLLITGYSLLTTAERQRISSLSKFHKKGEN